MTIKTIRWGQPVKTNVVKYGDWAVPQKMTGEDVPLHWIGSADFNSGEVEQNAAFTMDVSDRWQGYRTGYVLVGAWPSGISIDSNGLITGAWDDLIADYPGLSIEAIGTKGNVTSNTIQVTIISSTGYNYRIDAPLLTDRYNLPFLAADITLDRDSTSSIVDFESVTKNTLVDEFGYTGARRVYNFSPFTNDLTKWSTYSSATIQSSTQCTIAAVNNSRIVLTWAGSPPIGTEYIVILDIRLISGTGQNLQLYPQNIGSWEFAPRLINVTSTTQTYTAHVNTTTSGTTGATLVIGQDETSNTGEHVLEITNAMMETTTGQVNKNPSDFIGLNGSACSQSDIQVRYYDYENGNTIDSNGIVIYGTGAAIPALKGLSIWDITHPGQTVADDCKTTWPDGMVNDFVLQCDWTPGDANAATLMESGDVKLRYDGANITMVKGAFTATMALAVVGGTTYKIQSRVSATQGVDVFAGGIKGTGDADVSDGLPVTNLQIGSTALLTEHVNGGINSVIVIQGDLTDQEVIDIP